MATKRQVFDILAAASGPLSRVQLEDKVGEKYKEFATQLGRWEKQELIKDTGDHHYILTDKGREDALKTGEFKDIEDIENLIIDESKSTPLGGAEEEGASKIAVATTVKQQFLRLGKLSGVVPLQLIHQTADYVWEGGDYKDMNWVAQAMQELGLDKDIRTRWWHCWRAKMHQPIPSNLPPEFLSGKKADEKKDEESGKRDYILAENDNPTYVGEGLGDLDHKEALDLSKIRASAKARGTGQTKSESPGDSLAAKAVEKVIADMQPASGTPTDETLKVITQLKALKDLIALDAKPDSGDELTRLLSLIKSLKEVTADNKQAASPSLVKQLLVDNRTGAVTEVAPGQPVIIIRESAPSPQSTPIQVTDRDGKPMVLDLSTFIKLEEHRDKQKRDEESHQTKIEIAKSFKDLLKHAQTAMSHMGEK